MSNNGDSLLLPLFTCLPGSKKTIKRLAALQAPGSKPVVAAFGAYNHGKSTLLNALSNTAHFSVADKRETTEVSTLEQDNIIWMDTPGLEADSKKQDDQKAEEAVLTQADLILLVHNIKMGELDKAEIALVNRVFQQQAQYHSKIIVVLSQIEQLPEDDLAQVVSAVKAKLKEKLPDVAYLKVSAKRAIKGQQENKEALLAASGIDTLREAITHLLKDTAKTRQREATRLVRKLKSELSEKRRHHLHALSSAEFEQQALLKAACRNILDARNAVKIKRDELNLD